MYEIATQAPIRDIPHSVSEMYGCVTVVRWVAREAQVEDYVLIGTSDGWVFVWGTCHDVSAQSPQRRLHETDARQRASSESIMLSEFPAGLRSSLWRSTSAEAPEYG